MSQAERSTTQTGAAPPRWLACDFADDLPPFEICKLVGTAVELGAAEQIAVATGAAVPDVCLIQGGSAETRAIIATEIATRSPGRTLLLAPDPTALHAQCARSCAACIGARPPSRSWLGWLTGLFGRRQTPGPCAHAPVTAGFDAIPNRSFDRVVILEAQRLDEATIESAVARAVPRSIFLGCLEPRSPFDALWRRLTLEPWTRENGRLVCRLRRVPPRLRGELEIETVADRSEIELRILPRPQPELAEIAFPADIRIEDAETYVVQQLGEAPALQTSHGRAVTLPTHRRAEDTVVASQAVETLA